MRLYRFPDLPAELCRGAQATALSIKEFSASARVAIGDIECAEFTLAGESEPFEDPWIAEWEPDGEQFRFTVRRYPGKNVNFTDLETGEPLFSLSDELEASIKDLIAKKLTEYIRRT
jgi:hypothetical protein